MTVLNQADAIYLGDQAVDAVYLGAEKVWPPPPLTGYAGAVLQDNPLAYWRLGDTGTTITDEKGGPTGSITGTATRQQPSILPNGEGASTHFSLNAYGQIPGPNAPIGGGALTVELWCHYENINPVQFGGWLCAFTRAALVTAWGNLPNSIWPTVGGWSPTAALAMSSPHPINEPFHVVIAVTAGATWSIYRNGNLINSWSNIARPSPPTENTAGFYINTDPFNLGGRAASGRRQEVALYAYELTAQQVANHWQAAQP